MSVRHFASQMKDRLCERAEQHIDKRHVIEGATDANLKKSCDSEAEC